MDAVIVFSHGSLLCGAGNTLQSHVECMRTQEAAPLIFPGYLNYSVPTFAESVRQAAAEGASRIIVTPYFLAPGYFVSVQMKRQVDAMRALYRGIEFVTAEPLGYSPELAPALQDLAGMAAPAEHGRRPLIKAAEQCSANPECPLFSTELCGRGSRFENSAGNPEPIATPSVPSALLLLLHGSPKPEANEFLFKVAEDLRASRRYPIVRIGFLECNAPLIPLAIEQCVADGVSSIVAVPCFLHTGSHVAEDIPTLLLKAHEKFPEVQFFMSDYLGNSPVITRLLIERTREAGQQKPGA